MYKKLIAVATGEIKHAGNGLCPDPIEGFDSRDPGCPACKILIEAEAEHDEMERELRAAEIRLHDVATLCANVESELAEIKRRTYVAVTCNHVGRMERAEARVAELEAERAEREKQEPVAWINEKNGFICKDPKNADFCVPLYVAPPVTAQSEGQIDKATSLLRRAADYLGYAGAPRLASEISSYLESQAQPPRGEG